MEIHTAQKIGLPFIPLNNPPKIYTVDGRTLGTGRITHRSTSVILNTTALHQEEFSFLITTTHKHPLILRNTWLRQHDPTIFWNTGKIVKWSAYCHNHCIHNPILHIHFTTVASTDAPTNIDILSAYHYFLDVSKVNSTGLPTHQVGFKKCLQPG